MTRYEINTSMEYAERRRIQLGEMLVDNKLPTDKEILEMLYGLYGLCFIILNDIRVQKEKENNNG